MVDSESVFTSLTCVCSSGLYKIPQRTDHGRQHNFYFSNNFDIFRWIWSSPMYYLRRMEVEHLEDIHVFFFI